MFEEQTSSLRAFDWYLDRLLTPTGRLNQHILADHLPLTLTLAIFKFNEDLQTRAVSVNFSQHSTQVCVKCANNKKLRVRSTSYGTSVP